MKHTQPIFDPATHYRIEVQGRVDEDWLKSFDGSAEIRAEIHVAESGQPEAVTVLHVRTDQAGIVGLVRRLHGLGLAILRLVIDD
jgi:hypothetical protein